MFRYWLIYAWYLYGTGVVIVASAIAFYWFISRLVKWTLSDKPGGMGKVVTPLAFFVTVSSLLWLQPLVEDIGCRRAGLRLAGPVDAHAEGLYWQSHIPEASAYSNGIRGGDNPVRRDLAVSLLRSLVEGRIGYLEVPYEPRTLVLSANDLLNQRLYVARTDNPEAECWLDASHAFDFHSVASQLPANSCIASETSQGVSSRFRIEGTVLDTHSGNYVGITDRSDGHAIASYRFATVSRSEANWFGMRRRHTIPLSCTADRLDPGPAAQLPAMQFLDAEKSVVRREELSQFSRRTWKPVEPLQPADPVPSGHAGVAHWIQKGKVRQLGPADLDLWRKALKSDKPNHISGFGAYLILGDIRLPAGLYGGNLIVWVLQPGASIPPGPRGHSLFYRVGDGCIWPPQECSGESKMAENS